HQSRSASPACSTSGHHTGSIGRSPVPRTASRHCTCTADPAADWGPVATATGSTRTGTGSSGSTSAAAGGPRRRRAHPGADPAVRDAASRAWVEWEDHHVAIGSGGYVPDPRWQDDEVRVTFATLVTHYWSHAAFCDPPILDRMSLLAGIPGFLVHGRRD